MIQEDYCSTEVIKLLKEKGFPFEKYKGHGTYIPSVTHSLAMKWLREIHQISIEVYVCCDKHKDGKIWAYSICKIYNSDKDLVPAFQHHKNYEQAVEAALKYSLEKLI